MQRLQRTGSFTSEAEVVMGEFVLVFLEKRNTRRANNIFAALCVYVLSPSVDNPGIQPENDDKARKIEYQKHAPYCINSNQALYNVTGSRYVKPYKILPGFQ